MSPPSSARFSIRRRLGEGGMGVVYEAHDAERGVAVALKTLTRFDGDALTRFKREFRSLQGLVHPNLVALDELFFENEQWFFTMELVAGVDFVTYVTGSAPRAPFQSTVRQAPSELAARIEVTVRERGVFSRAEEAKIRDGLPQLLEGLTALHALGKVHRDVKPSNVIVTPEGRVVLLDFGLIAEASSGDRSTETAIVGTPEYMAPEQAASREVGPTADLYAVGVMLYEILTGRLPFEGAPLQILIDKQARDPAPPSSVVAGIPADLDALCVKLLRFDPALRPSAADVLRALAAPRVSGVAPPRVSSDAPLFVGRDPELETLRAAFDVTTRGEPATVLVCGESGIGKSYLVRRFLARLLAEHPDAMILEGRCYERETVPYKTLDGIIDALSRRLSRMDAAEVATLLPTRSATLAQLFPVMLHVPQVAREHAALALTVDPQELRRRAFVALRDLFTRLAMRRPTVIMIDDLQWADDDGLRALAEILRSPEAPPLLLLGTLRRTSEEHGPLARVRAVIPGALGVIDLRTLGPADARALAVAVLRHESSSDGDPEAIAREAGGHPLFVEELARHVALGGSAGDDVKLDDAIWSRILQLEGPTRQMAELVAVAGKPIPQEVAASAAHIEPVEFNRRAATLRVANLARTSGARWVDAIEPYHDRVREAVLARVGDARRRALHEALAIAFEASSLQDPETLAAHWREAGNGARAAVFATAAGDQASKTFAFDRAAQWYEQALDLTPHDPVARRLLRIKLGDALAFAGRGALAAPHLEAAAAQSPPMEALELRRRAADQLLRSGQVDAGLDASRAVLASIGIGFPETHLGTVIAVVFYRVVLALRGLRFRQREPGQITAEALARIDTCTMLGHALAYIDPFLGVVFQTRALLLALRAGELERVSRAVSIEAGFRGRSGGPAWRRTEWLLAHARSLADRAGSVEARAYAEGLSGVSLFCNGRYLEAIAPLERFLNLLHDGSTGLVHEQLSGRIFRINTLAHLGRFKELVSLQAEWLREAVARGDITAEVMMRTGFASLAWLALDQPEKAETQATTTLDMWSKKGFQLVHYYVLLTRIHVRLYQGDAAGAHALMIELRARARPSSMWRVQLIRLRVLWLGALTSLYFVEQGLGDRRALLAEIERDVRAVAKERMPSSMPYVALVRAGVALLHGQKREAIAGLEDACRQFETQGMLAYAAATREGVARLREDGSTAGELERVDAFCREERIVAPERFLRMHVPGFGGT